jgi:hypothetical protein
MSLVGSLEDLGLGDILQIISLSGKSGVLVLRADGGEGQISFDNGLIRSAFLVGGASHLQDLLGDGAMVTEAALESACQDARSRGLALGPVLRERGLLDEERLDGLLREHIEQVVLQMFTWSAGEFSFEVRNVEETADDLFVSPGVNPQFLALEGTRFADERAYAAKPQGAGGADLAPESAAMLDPEPPGIAEAELLPDEPRPVSEVVPPPLVFIEPDLAVLEWIKTALGDEFAPVHVFQRSDLAIQRIRQYLARPEIPLVILAEDAPDDPVSGARDSWEICARLKRQVDRTPVLMMHDEGIDTPTWKDHAAKPDGWLRKPTLAQLVNPRCAEECARLAEDLRDGIRGVTRSSAAGRPGAPANEMVRLKEVNARLRDPANRGVVLPEVLSFAAENFSRVALFMIRDDQALGIAQIGLPRAGGPDEAGLRDIHISIHESAAFRQVVESRVPLRGAPRDAGDQRLAFMLGNELPQEFYVAPIQSADAVVALLYADTLPGSGPLPDTGPLEVMLHSAGMALDRAVLERSLEEFDG